MWSVVWQGRHVVQGLIYNLNTIERFRSFHRAGAMQQASSQTPAQALMLAKQCVTDVTVSRFYA
jgi:hypothetical protein